MTRDYQALALDLDGTLLNEAGELEAHLVEALQRASQNGVAVFLASGRMLPAVLPHWRRLGLNTPVISYNGAQIGVPGEPPVYAARLSASLATAAVRYCRKRGLHLNAYCEDRLYVFEDSPVARWYADNFGVPFEVLKDAADWPGGDPTKLLVIVEEEQVESVFAELSAAFSAQATLTISNRRFVEILPPGADKGAAIRRLAESRGIPLERWVAVGDGLNDREMIRAAGLGVAVEHADAALRAAAGRIVPALPLGGLEILLREAFGFDA